MTTLTEKLRAARLHKVEAQGYVFTIRRPTDYEAAQFGDTDRFDIVLDYVEDWGEMRERDVIPDGGNDLVAFDRDLWREWIPDHPELWQPLLDKIVDAYTTHTQALDDAKKKSASG